MRAKSNKKLIFSLLSLVLMLAFIELTGRFAYYILYGTGYRAATMSVDAGLDFIARLPAANDKIPVSAHNLFNKEPLHPYLGYAVTRKGAGVQGFQGKFLPTEPAGENVSTILLTGGSVAAQVWRGGLEGAFNSYLAERGPRKVRVFPVVAGGFKQPQQLQALSYLLSIGAQFDVVINLDGFNDLVLPYVENARANIYPFYPRSWQSRLVLRSGGADQVTVGEIAYLRKEQREWVRWLQRSILGNSAIAGIAVRGLIASNANRIASLEKHIAVARGKNAPYDLEFNGPKYKLETRDQVVAESVNVWARSSVLMSRMARANGTEYYHFLQPNQYVSGSKPFSADERKHFIQPGHPYGTIAALGYPRLIGKGASLRDQDVVFFDLTQLFKDTADTVYRDTCCHFNKQGVNALIGEIVASVAANSDKFD